MTTWISDANGNKCSVARQFGVEILRDLTADCEDGCIEWEGYRDRVGYGRVWFEGRYQLAHRVSYAINCERIATGLCILHRCDNPSCVNPRHLLAGTQIANIMDRDAKGRAAQGDRNAKAKLSTADVRAIRADHRSTRKIASEYGVAASCISNIKTLKSWRHI